VTTTLARTLEDLELHPVRIPMRHRFRRVEHRDAVLIRGPEGWGEFSPFPEYPPAVARRWLTAALESASVAYPRPRRGRVAVNVTIPAVEAATARRLTLESGCHTAKVKVAEPGQTEQEDLARLEAVRDALGPEGGIRVDANAAWDVPTAIARIRAMSRFGLEYVEQPVATIDEMKAVREAVEVPIAADELVRTLPDPAVVAAAGAADVIVVKVQPLGGVGATLELASRIGLPVVVSSALETSVGMAAGVAAAAALPHLPYACGLGTVALLGGDVVTDPLEPRQGWVDVRRPAPDPELLERYHPGKAVGDRMLDRAWEAAKLLT
jgi:o-succinylbenzoate synthase